MASGGPVTRSRLKLSPPTPVSNKKKPRQSTPRPVPRTPAKAEKMEPQQQQEQPAIHIHMDELVRAFNAGIERVLGAMEARQDNFAQAQADAFEQQRVAMQGVVRAVAAEQPRDIFRELPSYAGAPEGLAEWLANANRIRQGRLVVDAVAIQECAAKLTGIAREWHDRVGVGYDAWAEWSGRLRQAFGPKMSMLEWHYLMETRVQRPRESATAYILDKSKLFHQCPQVVQDAECIPFLIRGLSSPELRGALSRNVPATVGALMTAITEMEAYQPTSLTFLRNAGPQPGQTVAPRSQHAQVSNQQPFYGRREGNHSYNTAEAARFNRPDNNWPAAAAPAPALPSPASPALPLALPEARAAPQASTPGPSRPVATAPSRPSVNNALPPPRYYQDRAPRTLDELQCFGCGYYGHLRRDCRYDSRQGNGPAGPSGQVRQ